MNVFTNLTEEAVQELYNKFISQGYSEDDAFTEVYSMECNQDEYDD